MEKKRYKTMTFRLSDETIKNLKKEKIKSGLSWNLFFYNLLKCIYGKNN